MRQLMRILRVDLVLRAFVCVFFGFLGLTWFGLYHAAMRAIPPVATLERLEIDLPDAGDKVVIGRTELAQSPVSGQAEAAHVAFWHDPVRGGAMVQNLASARIVGLVYTRPEGGCSASTEITTNMHILSEPVALQLNETVYQLSQVNGGVALKLAGIELVKTPVVSGYGTGRLYEMTTRSISIGGRVAHDDYASLSRGLLDGAKALVPLWNRAPAFRVAQADVPEQALRVRPVTSNTSWACRLGLAGQGGSAQDKEAGRQDGRPIYALSTGRGTLARVTGARTGEQAVVGQVEWPLEHPLLGALSRITIGRTTYALARGDALSLTLTPVQRPHWRPAESTTRHEAAANPDRSVRQIQSRPIRLGLPASGGGVKDTLAVLAKPFMSLQILAVGLVVFLTLVLPRLFRYNAITLNARLYLTLLASNMVLVSLVPQSSGSIYRLASENPTGFALTLTAILPALDTRLGWRARAALVVLHLVSAFLLYRFWWEIERPPVFWAAGSYGAIVALIALTTLAGCMMAVRSLRPAGLLFWTAFMIVLTLGTLSPALLTLGHGYSQFTELFGRHLFALAMGSYVIIGLASVRASFLRQAMSAAMMVGSRRRKGMLKWLPTVATYMFLVIGFLLFVITFATDEGGTGGVQPSELNKSFIVLGGAFLFVVTVNRVQMLSRISAIALIWVQLLVFLAVVGGLLGASLVNFDMSPILIVGITLLSTVAMALTIYGLQTLPLRLATALVIFLPLGVFFVFGFGPSGLIAAFVVYAVLLAIVRARRPQDILTPLSSLAQGTRFNELRDIQFRGMRVKFALAWRRFWDYRTRFRKLLIVLGFSSVGLTALFLAFETSDTSRLERFESFLPNVPIERIIAFRDATLTPAQDARPVLRFPDLSFQVSQSRVLIAGSGCGLDRLFVSYFESTRAARSVPEPLRVSLLDGFFAKIANAGDRLVDLSMRGAQRFLHMSLLSDWLGLCGPHVPQVSPGPTPRAVYGLPAVQDDFAGSFLIARLGIDAAGLLVLAQCGMIVSMLAVGAGALISGIRQPRLFEPAVFGSFTLFGFAVTLALQMTFAWGNTLGLLPVFGQPMTFLSLGASHHIFFAAPAVIFMAVITWAVGDPSSNFDENRDRIQSTRQMRDMLL